MQRTGRTVGKARPLQLKDPGTCGALRFALLAYGVLNAILYSGLLPLWDGFDEPFHYAFLQHLSDSRKLPVWGETVVSGEVSESLQLAPASHLVKVNMPFVTTFFEYFRLPADERARRRAELAGLKDPQRLLPSGAFNYEAQQAPLAYALLAPLDAAWRNMPLLSRVFRLRLIIALVTVAAVWALILRLGSLLELPEEFRLLAIFLTFSWQVFYATIAHVAPDWLALVMFSLILVCAVALVREPGRGKAFLLGLSIAAGLLTKASLLTTLPLGWGLALRLRATRRLSWRDTVLLLAASVAIPSPWYIRNLTLYGNLTGMFQARGVTVRDLIRSAWQVPWLSSIWTAAKAAIWTGNNSDTSFNSRTVSGAVLLLALAACLWLWSSFRSKSHSAESVLAAGLICYAIGLVYSVVLFYWSTRGVGIAAVPWYVEVAAPPATCGLCLGLARAGVAGKTLSFLMIWLWSYLIGATYIAKLIPFYSGHIVERVHLADLVHYYRDSSGSLGEGLGSTALAPPNFILALTVAVVLLALILAAFLSIRIVTTLSHD